VTTVGWASLSLNVMRSRELDGYPQAPARHHGRIERQSLREKRATQGSVMITIQHLGVSQSDRIVWLMEELGLPYELKWYKRGPDRLAPSEFLALHPAATAPIVEDCDTLLAESGAIVEYICHRHAGGRLTVRPEQPNYADYLYWMHFNNNTPCPCWPTAWRVS
jgi:hypothetical protein